MNNNIDTRLDKYTLDVFVLESDCETIKYLDDLDKHKKEFHNYNIKESNF